MDSKIFLMPLRRQDIPEFKKNMQESFSVTVTEVFGAPENGPIPSDADIDGSLCDKNAHAFRIFCDKKETGGAIVLFDKASRRASLDLFFLFRNCLGKGIGYRAWEAIECAFPQTKVWELYTPCFEKRNIHFYVNKCGFHIVEYFNPHHPDPHGTPGNTSETEDFFRFEKQMGLLFVPPDKDELQEIFRAGLAQRNECENEKGPKAAQIALKEPYGTQAEEYRIAYFAGEKIGWIRLQRDTDQVLLNDLYILPHKRRKGFAKEILRHVCNEAPCIGAYVFQNNVQALALYQSFGFHPVRNVRNMLFLQYKKNNSEIF